MLGSCLGQALTDTRSKEEVVLRAGVGLLERRGERADRFLSFLNTALDPECTPRLARPPPPPPTSLGSKTRKPHFKVTEFKSLFQHCLPGTQLSKETREMHPLPPPSGSHASGKVCILGSLHASVLGPVSCKCAVGIGVGIVRIQGRGW